MTVTTEVPLTQEQRAANGAQWLDEVKPGWVDLIDTDELDLWHPFRCVLGQVFREEAEKSDEGSGYNFIYFGTAALNADWICSRGFAGSIRNAWLPEIEKRRAA